MGSSSGGSDAKSHRAAGTSPIRSHAVCATVLAASKVVTPAGMDKMKAALGIFKYESQIGNGARAFPTSDLDKCVDTFHDWGFTTHVHDKVEVVEE